MRNESRTTAKLPEKQQTVLFEIANGNQRQACSLKTKFPTQHQTSRYLRQNWNTIEQMARDCLARQSFEDGRINLVMIQRAGTSRSPSHNIGRQRRMSAQKGSMNNCLLIAGALSLFLSGSALAQHGGTEQEQRACAGSVQRYCRPVLDQGDFAVLACLQQHRQKLTAPCRKVLADHGQ